MPDDYVSKDVFDQYKETAKEQLDEIKAREIRNFQLIFDKLEEIKNNQTQQSGHTKNLEAALADVITDSEFNTQFDARMKDQGLLNKEKLDLRFVARNDANGNPIEYVKESQDFKILMISFTVIKWLFGLGSGGTVIYAFVRLLFG